MRFEKKKWMKRSEFSVYLSDWPFIRIAQGVLGLISLGYFFGHPSEWISLVLGLGLTAAAIFRAGCSSTDCPS